MNGISSEKQIILVLKLHRLHKLNELEREKKSKLEKVFQSRFDMAKLKIRKQLVTKTLNTLILVDFTVLALLVQ